MEKASYFDTAREIAQRIETLAHLTTTPGFSDLTKRDLARIQHVDWVPEVMLDYGRRCNGFNMTWRTTSKPACNGSINLLPLQKIYGGEWQGTVYHGTADEDPRLRTFKPVDLYAPDTCVGLYHDERADPALYYYEFGEEPQPLGLSIQGYFQLLPLTLGTMHWPLLLLEAAALPLDAPYQPQSVTTHTLVERLAQVQPAFQLADFIATYRQLRRAQ